MKFVLLISCLGFQSVLSHRLGDDDSQQAFALLDADSLGRKDSQELSAEVSSAVNHTGVLIIGSSKKQWHWPEVGKKLRALSGRFQAVFPRTVTSYAAAKAFFKKHKKAIYNIEKLVVGITLLSVSIACPACAAGVLAANLAFAVTHALIDTYYNVHDKDKSTAEVVGNFVFTVAVATTMQLFAFGIHDFGLAAGAASVFDLVDGICGSVGDALGTASELKPIARGDSLRTDVVENMDNAQAQVGDEGGVVDDNDFVAPPQRRKLQRQNALRDVARGTRPRLQRQNAQNERMITASSEPMGQVPLGSDGQPLPEIKAAFKQVGIAFSAFAGEAAGHFTCSAVTAAKEVYSRRKK